MPSEAIRRRGPSFTGTVWYTPTEAHLAVAGSSRILYYVPACFVSRPEAQTEYPRWEMSAHDMC